MPSQPEWRRGRPQDREWTPAEDWRDSSAGGSPFAGRPYVDGQTYRDPQPSDDQQSYGDQQLYRDPRPYGDPQPDSDQQTYRDPPSRGDSRAPFGNAPYSDRFATGYPGDHATGLLGDPRLTAGGTQFGGGQFSEAQFGGAQSGGTQFGDAPFPGDSGRGQAGPAGPGPGGPGRGGRDGRRWPRIGLSIAAAALVVVGLGAYGVARMHHSSALTAMQDSAGGPCASQGQGSSAAQPCPAGGAAGSGAATSPAASASASARARHHKKHHHHQVTPTPTPTPTHTAAPRPHPSPSSSAPAGTSSGSAATQVLDLINSARAQAGLPAYTMSSGLDTSSRRHTMVMAGGCGLSHQCPGEASLGDRLTAAGVQWTAAGENIGEGGPEPDSSADIAKMATGLTQSMLAEKPPDDGHRLNILSSSFHHVGIYVFRDSHGTVWMTQDFSN